MGLGWSDIKQMSLWEYEARLYHYNEAHGGNDDAGDRPDPRVMQARVDALNERLRREGA